MYYTKNINMSKGDPKQLWNNQVNNKIILQTLAGCIHNNTRVT